MIYAGAIYIALGIILMAMGIHRELDKKIENKTNLYLRTATVRGLEYTIDGKKVSFIIGIPEETK